MPSIPYSGGRITSRLYPVGSDHEFASFAESPSDKSHRHASSNAALDGRRSFLCCLNLYPVIERVRKSEWAADCPHTFFVKLSLDGWTVGQIEITSKEVMERFDYKIVTPVQFCSSTKGRFVVELDSVVQMGVDKRTIIRYRFDHYYDSHLRFAPNGRGRLGRTSRDVANILQCAELFTDVPSTDETLCTAHSPESNTLLARMSIPQRGGEIASKELGISLQDRPLVRLAERMSTTPETERTMVACQPQTTDTKLAPPDTSAEMTIEVKEEDREAGVDTSICFIEGTSEGTSQPRSTLLPLEKTSPSLKEEWDDSAISRARPSATASWEQKRAMHTPIEPCSGSKRKVGELSQSNSQQPPAGDAEPQNEDEGGTMRQTTPVQEEQQRLMRPLPSSSFCQVAEGSCKVENGPREARDTSTGIVGTFLDGTIPSAKEPIRPVESSLESSLEDTKMMDECLPMDEAGEDHRRKRVATSCTRSSSRSASVSVERQVDICECQLARARNDEAEMKLAVARARVLRYQAEAKIVQFEATMLEGDVLKREVAQKRRKNIEQYHQLKSAQKEEQISLSSGGQASTPQPSTSNKVQSMQREHLPMIGTTSQYTHDSKAKSSGHARGGGSSSSSSRPRRETRFAELPYSPESEGSEKRSQEPDEHSQSCISRYEHCRTPSTLHAGASNELRKAEYRRSSR